MQETTIYMLFSILRSVFHDNQMSDYDKQLVTEGLIADVMTLASKHDIAHLVALGLLNNDLADDETKMQHQQSILRTVYRCEKINYELERVCEALEKAKIPFVPLKGSVIRKYYPEPWMRTSCDIDILVRESDLRRAISYLVEQLKYTEHEHNSHDISLFSSSGVHLELHYDLVEEGWANFANSILQNVWDYVSKKKDHEYWFEMSDAMLYFYHIAHMAKHLQQGGCGIRTFIDLWILDNLPEVDKSKRNDLLKTGGLLQFSRVASKLSTVWLDNVPLDRLCEKIQSYILAGGVYGTKENRILLQQQKKGGKIKYAMSKIVIPYETIKFHYPILQKYRWLTPLMQVRRWFKLIFCGHSKRAMRELSYNSNISQSKADEMKIFLDEIGL